LNSVSFNGNQNNRLAFGPTAAFAGLFAADEKLINFDTAG
jgi:hypothetical protein